MRKTKSAIKKFTGIIPVDYLFTAVCFAFFIASGFAMAFTENYNASEIDVTNRINISYFLMVFAVSFVGIIGASYLLNKKSYIARGILISVVFFGIITMIFNSGNIYLIIGIALIAFITVYWCIKNNRIEIYSYELSDRALYISVFAIALLIASFIFVVSLCRYLNFDAPNFDFGIFASMFESMRKTGLPNITNERNVMMSHFGVHFSPFFYLLLPVYMIFPSPVTLIGLQSVFITAGVIPLILICRHFKLQNIYTLIISIAYLLFPGFVYGGINDFHENAFLTFIILFLFYFLQKNKNVLFFVFLALLLSIKEDAAIYAVTLGLFMLFYKRMYLKSVIIIAVSVIYFIFASMTVEALNTVNEGIMSDRFENYMPKVENSLIAVIHTCFYNFSYFIGQVFTSEKLLFLCWVFIPFAFMPFMSKRKALLILLLPMLVINIMSNWPYQFDITYQYTFGTGALVIISSVIVLSEKSNRAKAMLCMFSLIMSIVVFFGSSFQTTSFIKYYTLNSDVCAKWDEFLDELPKDEEYMATSSVIAHMYDFPYVYSYPNFNGEDRAAKYLVTISYDRDAQPDFKAYIDEHNYELIKIERGMTLFKSSDYE